MSEPQIGIKNQLLMQVKYYLPGIMTRLTPQMRISPIVQNLHLVLLLLPSSPVYIIPVRLAPFAVYANIMV